MKNYSRVNTMYKVLKLNENMTKPYKPYITLEDILAFRVEDVTTHTTSPIINAVASALCETKALWCADIAKYLEVDVRMLSNAIMLETGLSFIEIIREYRMYQIEEYIKNHPNENLDAVAQANGYASAGTLWRFFQRRNGTTPLGKKSHAGQELWLKWREEKKRKR